MAFPSYIRVKGKPFECSLVTYITLKKTMNVFQPDPTFIIKLKNSDGSEYWAFNPETRQFPGFLGDIAQCSSFLGMCTDITSQEALDQIIEDWVVYNFALSVANVYEDLSTSAQNKIKKHYKIEKCFY